jgi:hypothetical protein
MSTVRSMLRSGNQIRLTPSEIELFTTITGFVPENVKTVGDLDTYVKRCKGILLGYVVRLCPVPDYGQQITRLLTGKQIGRISRDIV